MNNLKIGILIVAFLFILITLFVDLPTIMANIIYGIMGIFAIIFLFVKRKDLEIDSMFDKNSDSSPEE